MTKTEFYTQLSEPYCRLLAVMRLRLIRRFKSQASLAKFLQIDSSNLSKIFSGVIKPNALLFFHLIYLANMDIVRSDVFKETIPPHFETGDAITLCRNMVVRDFYNVPDHGDD